MRASVLPNNLNKQEILRYLNDFTPSVDKALGIPYILLLEDMSSFLTKIICPTKTLKNARNSFFLAL